MYPHLRDDEKSFEDVVDVQFDPNVKKADKWDYIVAASSGVLTAALDVLWTGDFSLTDAQNWGREKTNGFVLKIAQSLGYKGNDLSGAIAFLEKKFPIAADKVTADFGGGLQHHLRDFSHHPSIMGLIFSILTQFTHCGYGTDTNGDFIIVELPDDGLIGKNFAEKMFLGTVGWAFHLISDMAGSSQNAGAGTGIPGMLLSLLNELSALPLFKNIQVNYKDSRITFSKLLSKLFNGTYFVNEETGERVRFDLRTEIGLAGHIGKQTIPVIINECVVRGFFMICRLCEEVSDQEIACVSDLEKIDLNKIVPYKNRELIRMLTISSGTFMAIVTGSALAKSAVKSKGDKGKFAQEFFLSVNYVGIGRFVFACKADAKYMKEDFQKAYKEFLYTRDYARPRKVPGLEYLSLTPEQTKILYSLERAKIQYDIQETAKTTELEAKKMWCTEWENAVLEGLTMKDCPDYFLSQDQVFRSIEKLFDATTDTAWLQLVAMELFLFTPYYMLDSNQQNTKIKYRADYEKDVFCTKQNVISYDALKVLMKSYQKSLGELQHKIQKTLTGVAVGAVVTIASGGLAWAFAPQIAVLIAGHSFAGIYGIALTNASLAAIGGGALAAGGLGMAGGAAIIAGGGALLGVAGSGALSITSIMLLYSKDCALNECAKLITFCKEILLSRYGKEVILGIQQTVEKGIYELEKEADSLINSTDIEEKERKKLLKESKESMKYLKRCSDSLAKLASC